MVVGRTEARIDWIADIHGCSEVSHTLLVFDPRTRKYVVPTERSSYRPTGYTIRNLKPSTHYYFVAVDLCGGYSVATQVSFTTLAGAVALPTPVLPVRAPNPPNPPENVTVVVGRTEARITWVPDNPGNCGSVSHTLWVFDPRTRKYIVPTDVSSSRLASFTIRNLKPETHYYFVAVDRCGGYSVATQVNFTTLASAAALPTPEPTDTRTPVPPTPTHYT